MRHEDYLLHLPRARANAGRQAAFQPEPDYWNGMYSGENAGFGYCRKP
ncbi:hypothetical protein HMPREF3038_00416 [Akkermansia sp. KLE1797]|nr:hypothetical protein HMPREF3038_00416 [Akkermansia sp. KLE1797]KXU54992.1 hypothetical protein HMPREF3039_00717 [Akkermansia sp. KLE1798]KZA04379.1 hypothetical protein HMPREF1326_02047 [Akkermansia sp. KLE1605]